MERNPRGRTWRRYRMQNSLPASVSVREAPSLELNLGDQGRILAEVLVDQAHVAVARMAEAEDGGELGH